MRQTQDKEYHRQKRSAESDIEKERRLNKQKKYEHEKRSAESEIAGCQDFRGPLGG